MAIFTDSAGTAIALAVKMAGLHIACGQGLPDWDIKAAPPPPEATGLASEVGCRAATLIEFCTPDPAGEIDARNENRYAPCHTPTRFLHVLARFDEADNAGETLRESAVFIGRTFKPEVVTAGRLFYTPEDILEPGEMLLLDRFSRVERTKDFRTKFEFVLCF